jgi:exonuclease III
MFYMNILIYSLHHAKWIILLGTPFEIVSWNVDGIRAPGRDAALVKLATTRRPDVICLQETKLQPMHEGDWVDMLNAHGYSGVFASSTEKKGCRHFYLST